MENEVNNGLENKNPINNNAPLEMPANSNVNAPIPNDNPTPKAKPSIAKFIPLIIALGVVIVLVIGGLTLKFVSSSPKQVFKNTINNVFKEINNGLDEVEEVNDILNVEENATYISGDVKIETNIEDLIDGLSKDTIESISKLTLSYEAGIDLENEQLLGGIKVTGSDSSIDAKVYYTNDYVYLTSSVLEEIVKTDTSELGSSNIDFSEYEEMLSEINEDIEFNTEDYDYILEAFKKALIKSLDSEKMQKGSGSFEVDDKTINATKVSYTFDEDALSEYVKSVCEILKEDDEFLSKLASITNLDKSDIEDALEELIDSADDIEMSDEFAVNIYLKGLLNKVVGFSVEYDEKEYFSVYNDGDKTTEIKFDNHSSDDYGKIKLVATAVAENDETTISIKYNKEQIATVTVRELSDEVIDFDVKVNYDDDTYKMSMYLSRLTENDKISGEFKYAMTLNDEYAKYSGSYSIEPKANLIDIDISKAVDIDEIDTEKLVTNIEDVVKNDEAFNDLLGDSLDDMKTSLLDLNSYGMKETTSSKATSLLNNTTSTVLFVGDTYYSSYSEADAKAMFENLKKAQEELDFYSYFLDEYDVSEDFIAATSTVQYICNSSSTITEPETENTENVENIEETETTETSTCSNYPALYLIKDGQIVKAYRGTISYDDLKNALAEIDIK